MLPFMKRFHSVGDLNLRVKWMMPANWQNSLGAADYLNVVAYLLQANAVPVGTEPSVSKRSEGRRMPVSRHEEDICAEYNNYRQPVCRALVWFGPVVSFRHPPPRARHSRGGRMAGLCGHDREHEILSSRSDQQKHSQESSHRVAPVGDTGRSSRRSQRAGTDQLSAHAADGWRPCVYDYRLRLGCGAGCRDRQAGVVRHAAAKSRPAASRKLHLA